MMNEPKEGEILMLDKPYGWSSFKALYTLKKIVGAKKAGHAGTLDPLATGLLIVCTERSTKKINTIQDAPKEYVATIKLGATTPCGDLEMEESEWADVPEITEVELQNVTTKFIGDVVQTPPIFSAIKVDGQRAYKLARNGEDVAMKQRTIHIYALEIKRLAENELEITVNCSKGTYIRTLAMDIAKELGTLGYLTKLCRTRIGEHKLEEAKSIDQWREAMQEKIE